MYIHWKQLVGTKVLRQGDTLFDNTEYDKSKGRYKAMKCAVTSSEAESKGNDLRAETCHLGELWVLLSGQFSSFFQSLTRMFG